MSQEGDNKSTTNLTLAHLELIVRGLEVAQRKGAFTFQDSALLAEPVRIVNELIQQSRPANSETNETDETSESTAENTNKSNETSETTKTDETATSTSTSDVKTI